MIVEKLRMATAEVHQKLDHTIFPHIKRIDSVDKYVSLLKVFYGFLKPMYNQFNLWLDEKIVPDFCTRRNADNIANGLSGLQLNISHISLCNTLPAINNTAETLGAYYVLEGSTLGGTTIAKTIKQKPRFD